MPTPPRLVRRAHVDLGRVTSTPAAGLVLDSESREVLIQGERADMTFREFELLHFLVSNPGRVFTREQLLSSVWGYSSQGITRTVDVHVHRLRRKLGPEYGQFLITVSRVGYRFAPPAAGSLPGRDQATAWLAEDTRAWRAALQPLTSEQRKMFIDTLRAYERESARPLPSSIPEYRAQ